MIKMRIVNGQIEHYTDAGPMAGNRRGQDLFQGRVVTSMCLTPRSVDGKSGGEVIKRTRVGPKVQAQFAAVTPYFKLNDRRRADLEAEVAGLKAKIAAPGLDPTVKQKLAQDLAKLQHELDMDKSPTPDGRTFQELRARG